MGINLDDASLEEIQGFFSLDRFATDACGCVIEVAEPGHAVCSFEITDTHRNMRGNVMGGAIFTLADFALAVASNVGQEPTVSVSNTIEYLRASRGTRLIATANADKAGRRLAFFTIDVTDNLGAHIARMTATCCRAGS